MAEEVEVEARVVEEAAVGEAGAGSESAAAQTVGLCPAEGGVAVGWCGPT